MRNVVTSMRCVRMMFVACMADGNCRHHQAEPTCISSWLLPKSLCAVVHHAPPCMRCYRVMLRVMRLLLMEVVMLMVRQALHHAATAQVDCMNSTLGISAMMVRTSK